MITVRSPGRVNLIGDHTDYTGGLVLPMAIDRATMLVGSPAADRVELTSADQADVARVELDVRHPERLTPQWAKYVGGVVAEMRPAQGFAGHVTTTIPIGAGLSSSAALELAVALALGFEGTPTQLAQMCQRAEQRASGVPCGIMDQLCIAAGQIGHATFIDCRSLEITLVPVPEHLDVVVVFGHSRTLAGSEYATRVAECAAAEAAIGPLRDARLVDTTHIDDWTVRARARHVISENARVLEFCAALATNDRFEAGRLMNDSHASLAADYETSTPRMDALVSELADAPGVWGARMTGGGFGGCAVALCEPGALDHRLGDSAWVVTASNGAHVVAE